MQHPERSIAAEATGTRGQADQRRVEPEPARHRVGEALIHEGGIVRACEELAADPPAA